MALEKKDGSKVVYRSVGGDEIDSDTSKGYISVDSSMSRAMLKKQVDDEVVLRLGENITRFYITSIPYK